MSSPNRDDWEIPVEYLVLHYTAVDLQDTLAIFMKPGGVISAHLVIDRDGSIYELVDCLEGKTLRGRHSGPSQWLQGEKLKEQFNDFSIGIELVNYNGNIFPFTDEQYSTLTWIVNKLQRHYPALNDPGRIVGHEHIAGFRGKADPGLCFDWPRFYQDCFPEQLAPLRTSVCPNELQRSLMNFQEQEPRGNKERSKYWQAVSHITETSIKLINEAKNSAQ
ncbi:N-acetylmuramoyl-L-alanine amidase [Endozoicomonas sp. Mp262]|uniref:N-acetylmuramoyl-L-alanine amidase n=1 Tax=Endozoicomonas sp. Mp262 TaxID=2919499 RepID=UPI0021D8E199